MTLLELVKRLRTRTPPHRSQLRRPSPLPAIAERKLEIGPKYGCNTIYFQYPLPGAGMLNPSFSPRAVASCRHPKGIFQPVSEHQICCERIPSKVSRNLDEGVFQPDCWASCSPIPGHVSARVLGVFQPDRGACLSPIVGRLSARSWGISQPECGYLSTRMWASLNAIVGGSDGGQTEREETAMINVIRFFKARSRPRASPPEVEVLLIHIIGL